MFVGIADLGLGVKQEPCTYLRYHVVSVVFALCSPFKKKRPNEPTKVKEGFFRCLIIKYEYVLAAVVISPPTKGLV